MPPGHIHYSYYRRTVIPALLLCGLGYFLKPDLWPLWAWAAVNYLLCRWIDPDLDEIGMTTSEGRMMRELSIFGVILTAWWSVYAFGILVVYKLFGVHDGVHGAHRSFLTHSIFPGTVLRMVWFNIPTYGCIWLSQLFFDYKFPFTLHVVGLYLGGQFLAWATADLLHVTMDKSPKWRNYTEPNTIPVRNHRERQGREPQYRGRE